MFWDADPTLQLTTGGINNLGNGSPRLRPSVKARRSYWVDGLALDFPRTRLAGLHFAVRTDTVDMVPATSERL